MKVKKTIKSINDAWIIVTNTGDPLHWSLSTSKKWCIDNYSRGLGASSTEEIESIFINAKKRGHRIVKVKATFEEQ